ncbi:hypothetical protein A9W98_01605 [Mycobacterium gordonae]|jgi:hypothetical protein|uniref:DUF4352 domain-containing protein n=1 Tax=Mycobacterium gordonae TaxID=1778 RepID=A0A1A6BG63_MYCGO|nr:MULTISPECIES: DUF4352 domain-containing protein [Mycobacterium]MBI2699391.1 DUF4352 domain-containing protein [Mycobacterium sp.]MCQ4360689.1 DUF4352 domain-containing protein [Mycobacterium gordonae]OBS01308.1 hypothetical protein A9W98_01605 [Mycobacterium gordonae]
MRRNTALAWILVALAASGCLGARHASAPSINDEVRVGELAFTVTSINLGVPATGHRTAQGVFHVVNLMIQNKGDRPRSVFCQDQTLRDPAGKRYTNVANIESPGDLVRIDPGAKVLVKCAFDVPSGTLPAAIELRDSPYSRGVTVRLLGGG